MHFKTIRSKILGASILLFSLVSISGYSTSPQDTPKNETLIGEEEIYLKTVEEKLKIAKDIEIQLKEEQERKRVKINPNNLLEKSNLTYNQIHSLIEGTPLESLSEDYLSFEEEYNLNALFVLSLNIEESGWGRSSIARDKNNISGQRINGVYRYFPTKRDCLRETFRLIREEYLDPEGKYYVYGTSIYDVNDVYCPDTPKYSWANNIHSIANQLRLKLEEI